MTDLEQKALIAAYPFGAVFMPFQAPIVESLCEKGLAEIGGCGALDPLERDFTLTADGSREALRLINAKRRAGA